MLEAVAKKNEMEAQLRQLELECFLMQVKEKACLRFKPDAADPIHKSVEAQLQAEGSGYRQRYIYLEQFIAQFKEELARLEAGKE
jgi:hypothetical protein